MKDIAIVIVNYKMKDLIDRCLETLFLDIEGDSLDIDVIVVDNNSDDGVGMMLQEKYPSVQFIPQNVNPGLGTSANVGMKAVQATYYFALNPDTEFFSGQNTIRRMYDFMESHQKIGMIGPKIMYPDGSLQYSCWRFPSFLQPFYNRTKFGSSDRGRRKREYHLMHDFDHDHTIPVDALMGSAMFVRGVAMNQVGGFDERFWMYYEDIDWCLRMWEGHWPVYYVHDMLLQHLHGRGSAAVPGMLNAFLKNKLFRAHVQSWLKYTWKWRGVRKYYRDSR